MAGDSAASAASSDVVARRLMGRRRGSPRRHDRIAVRCDEASLALSKSSAATAIGLADLLRERRIRLESHAALLGDWLSTAEPGPAEPA
jgi:hypothetical protein